MVKLMEKKKRKFGFSLTETMILITILAIAVAASTPIITRKIVNITDAGSTLSGGAHGRYEIYTKEIITFGPDSYEKTTDPDFSSSSGSSGGGASGSVVVLRRLPDSEYIEVVRAKGHKASAGVTNDIPDLNANGKYKETMYEQINDAKVHRKPNGEIEYVEFKDRFNINKRYPVGGDIIVENADVIYVKGCLDKNSTPKNFTKKGSATCLGTKVVLPNNENRIIEGHLTDYYNKHPQTDNKLWHLGALGDKAGNNEGEVTEIPWESVVSGDKTIIDRPIPPTRNPETGEDEYIGTFDPGQNAKNLVVHAVGGGGAGGGISDIGKAITPKNASANELNEMKITLANRFKEIARSKGINSFNSKSVDQIVKVVKESNLYKKSYENLFNINGNSSETDGYYIILNKYDGTITIRVDVRNGLIFPNELLDYTKVLGSPTQQAVIYDMPVWGNFDTIYNRGFRAGAVGCGGAGGAGSSYTVNHSTYDFDCKRNHFCPTAVISSCVNNVSCVIQRAGCYAAKLDYSRIEKEFGITGFAVPITIKNADNLLAASVIDTGGGRGSGSSKPSYKPSKPSEPSCTWHSEKRENRCIARYCDIESNCDQVQYTRKGNTTYTSSCPNAAANCSTKEGTFMSATCINSYPGAAGGAKPPCAIACKRVAGPIDVSVSCTGSDVGASGPSQSITGVAGVVSLSYGQRGKICNLVAGDKVAKSLGGAGGSPCLQTQVDVDNFTTSQNSALMKVAGLQQAYTDGKVMYVGSDADFAIKVFGSDDSALLSQATTKNTVIPNWLCESLCSSRSCGVKGDDGVAFNNCDDTTGINTNGQGRYNHIYAWTMPYSVNRLTYGEAGEAGEYKSTKISQVVAALKIKLGKGGVWTNEDWKTGKQGPDGTDTVVSMGTKTVLVAKGGKGGKQNQYTNRYDLCYAKAGVCKLGDKSTNCCESEKGTRSTKDILITAGKMSAFENIKALVGNSLIIGTGLGRGGDGAGTRAGVEENYDKRYFLNASGYGVNYPTSSVFQPPENEFASGSANANDYINKALTPSEMNFKGGDGAVIITW